MQTISELRKYQYDYYSKRFPYLNDWKRNPYTFLKARFYMESSAILVYFFKKLTQFLCKEGQLLLPMVELITQAEMAIDELIGVTGRAAIGPCLVRSKLRAVLSRILQSCPL